MTYQQILYEVSDRVATIKLNRPDRLNAWTYTMEREVREAAHAAGDDADVRVIVLTGAGRGFCAGFDTDALGDAAEDPGTALEESDHSAARSEEDLLAIHPDFRGRYSYFPSIRKPVIAAINGPVVGLGLVMALFCDVRIASSEARLGTAFSRLGLVAEHGISWTLPRLVGLSNALELLFSCRVIGAEEAHHMGLVNRVVPAEDFNAEIRAYAQHLATKVSPRSLRIMKAQLYNDLYRNLSETIEIADVEMEKSLQSEDFREGVAHYMEKRAPRFSGR
jgi:enoyl-CoA hydratase/carnithine racemase